MIAENIDIQENLTSESTSTEILLNILKKFNSKHIARTQTELPKDLPTRWKLNVKLIVAFHWCVVICSREKQPRPSHFFQLSSIPVVPRWSAGIYSSSLAAIKWLNERNGRKSADARRGSAVRTSSCKDINEKCHLFSFISVEDFFRSSHFN